MTKRRMLFLTLGLLMLSSCALPIPSNAPVPQLLTTGQVQTIIVQTLTAWPTSTRSATLPSTLTSTEVPNTITPLPPSPTLTPSATQTGVHPTQTPDQFVRLYFSNINISNYSLTWSLLSDNFKNAVNGPSQGGYQGYVQFWNTVHSVTVETVTVISQNDYYAAIMVNALFHYNSGVLTMTTTDYTLVYNYSRNTWLFDTTPAATSTPSNTPSLTPTQTITLTRTPTRSRTATTFPSSTPTLTSTDTPTLSPTPSDTSTPTITPTP